MISCARKLAVLLALGGCSFAMQGVDPARNREQEPQCTESTLPVFIDGIIASSLATALAEAVRTVEPPLEDEVVAVGAGTLGVSVLFAVSAMVGASKYNRCRHAKADWHVEQAIRERGMDARDGTDPVNKTLWCFETDSDVRCFETRGDCATQYAAVAASGSCTEQPSWHE